MARIEQRLREQWVLETFLSKLPNRPAGSLEFDDKPDLVIRGPRTIGIEHTDFAWSKSAREPDARRHLIEAACKHRWDAAGRPPIAASLFFDEHEYMKWRSTSAAEALVEVLAKYVPTEDLDWVELERHRYPGPLPERIAQAIEQEARERGVRYVSDLPAVVTSLRIARLPLGASSHFGGPWAHWVRPADAHRLQEIIDEKGALLPGYQACAEHWLVIHVGHESGTHMDLEAGPPPGPFDSPFDRVFLHSGTSDHVHELNVRRFRPTDANAS